MSKLFILNALARFSFITCYLKVMLPYYNNSIFYCLFANNKEFNSKLKLSFFISWTRHHIFDSISGTITTA